MAFLTLGTLLKKTSVADALQLEIDILQSLGFNATSWQEGSVQLTFLEMGATLYSNLTELTAAITSFGFNSTSEGDALTLFSDSNYDNQRFVATNTVGTIEHTTIVGAGPYVIVVGQLVVQDDINGFTYRNTTAGTFTSGSTVSLTYQAEQSGAAKNVSNNTIATLNTPLAGVSVNNPGPGGGVIWVTGAGIDSEEDGDIRVRNTTRWATLTITAPEDAYNNIVRNSTAAITRSTVDGNNPRGPGTVDIYIAGPLGAVSGGFVPVPPGVPPFSDQQTAQIAVDLKRPVTADPDVLLPTEVAVPFTATVFITAALDTPAERTAIEQALVDFINGQPIGGTDFGGGGIIPFAIISQTVTDFASVQNITWSTPTADIALATTELATVAAGPGTDPLNTFAYEQV